MELISRVERIRLGSDWEVGEQGKRCSTRGEKDIVGEGEISDSIKDGGSEDDVGYKGGDRR